MEDVRENWAKRAIYISPPIPVNVSKISILPYLTNTDSALCLRLPIDGPSVIRSGEPRTCIEIDNHGTIVLDVEIFSLAVTRQVSKADPCLIAFNARSSFELFDSIDIKGHACLSRGALVEPDVARTVVMDLNVLLYCQYRVDVHPR